MTDIWYLHFVRKGRKVSRHLKAVGREHQVMEKGGGQKLSCISYPIL